MMTRSKSFHTIWSNNIAENEEIVKNESGQSVIEFVLLFLIIITLSFTMLVGINKGIANIWVNTVNIIVQPTDSVVELP